MTTIHSRIKQRRLFLGLSMEKLAEEIGVKAWQTIQQWEKEGGTAPKRDRLEATARALQTTSKWLMFGEDPAWQPEVTFSEYRSKNYLGQSEAESSAHPYNPLAGNVPTSLISYPVDVSRFRPIYVVGKAQGGFPDRIWTDGDFPVGASDQYAELASPDPHAFLVPVVGDSMSPRFNEGEFVLVEPGTEPELEDDVLVRLQTGETLIKRLLSQRHGIRLGSYNRPEILTFQPEDITWIYYIAHTVPARKIKNRI